MGPRQAQTVKELLRSKFGAETWLTLCAEIQDTLRERKRDALVAYLLAQPSPAEAPSGKWENVDDLYAYYLLDVEMASCQLTSRLGTGLRVSTVVCTAMLHGSRTERDCKRRW